MSIESLIGQEERLLTYAGEDRIVTIGDVREMLAMEKERPLISSGIRALDDLIGGGFEQGEYVSISGISGMGKCHGKGTEILMYNGETKKVEDIKVGDLLMGDDSTPRQVKSTATGTGNLYRITGKPGVEYVVNEDHILCLKRTRTNRFKADKTTPRRDRKGEIKEISVKEYLESSNFIKTIFNGYRVGVDFNNHNVPIDPYFLGVWLGDGYSDSARITTADNEVKDFIYEYADRLGLQVTVQDQPNNKSKVYGITKGCKGNGFSLQSLLRENGLIGNKHIPIQYKANSREVRLQLLAGILDTDGYVNKPNGYGACFKSKRLADDLIYLARSLGLAANFNKDKVINGERYYRIVISGELSGIPVKIKRKKLPPRLQKKDPTVYAITITPMGTGEYYGFELDGNGRYLLGDFSVTHNTTLARTLSHNFAKAGVNSLWFSYEEIYRDFTRRFPESTTVYMPAKLIDRKLGWINERIWEGKLKFGTKAVFIDHLHFLTDGLAMRNPSLEIGGICRRITEIAKERNVVIFLIAHLTKVKFEEEPDMDDIRDSCVAGSELVYSNGNLVPISMINVGDPIVALGSSQYLQQTTVKAKKSVGVKPVFRITTRTGRTLICTGEHRFYAIKPKRSNVFGPNQGLGLSGWTELKDLAIGDKVAVVKKYPDIPKPKAGEITEDQATILGWILGDGHVSKRGFAEITAATEEEAMLIKQICGRAFQLNCKISPYKNANAFRVYLVTGDRSVKNHNKLALFLREIDCLKSKEQKEIPSIIFQQEGKVIGAFLRGLYQSDGSICAMGVADKFGNKTSRVITLHTISRKLATGTLNLLARIGIKASLYTNSIKKAGFRTKNSMINIVSIRGSHILTFKEKVGFYLSKQEKMDGLLSTWKPKDIPRKSDLFFDRIKSIEPIGEEVVFDIQSEKGSSFCVQEFLTHNSFITQEAHKVFMVWRRKVNGEYVEESVVKVCKDRRSGTIGKKVNLFFDGKIYREITKSYD